MTFFLSLLSSRRSSPAGTAHAATRRRARLRWAQSMGSGSRPRRWRSALRSKSAARRPASVFVFAVDAMFAQRPVASLTRKYHVPCPRLWKMDAILSRASRSALPCYRCPLTFRPRMRAPRPDRTAGGRRRGCRAARGALRVGGSFLHELHSRSSTSCRWCPRLSQTCRLFR